MEVKVTDKVKLIEDFKRLRTLQGVADIWGVSRERVRQIVKQYAPWLKSKYRERPKVCQRCGRGEDVLHISYKGLCNGCHQAIIQGRPRIFIHVKNCIRCGRNIFRKPRCKGLCMTCVYQTNPLRRASIKRSQQKYNAKPGAIERNRARSREYYRTHKEQMHEYHRAYAIRYYALHKEELKVYNHRRWIANLEENRRKSREAYHKNHEKNNR